MAVDKGGSAGAYLRGGGTKVLPGTPQSFRTPFLQSIFAGGERARNVAADVGQDLMEGGRKIYESKFVQNQLFPRSALLGGALLAAPSLMGAAESASEGRTLEASVTAAGGLGSAAVASQLLKGPLPAKLAGVAVGLGGGLVSGGLGQMAERTKAAATGQEIAGQPGSSSAARGRRKKDSATDLEIQQMFMNQEIAGIQQLDGYFRNAALEQMKKELPIVNQYKNAELARNQALMNTMTGNYARLGMLATAGKLATGAQAERGMTMRTALQSNPYSGAIMQAPSISF